MPETFVWEGDPENLPPEGEVFFYNGEEYRWTPCNCKESCRRPTAYKNGNLDFGMTTRLRGNDQGEYLITVLVKLGKMEEVINTGYNPKALGFLLAETLTKIPWPGDPDFKEFLESKGISPLEMFVAVSGTIGLPPELALSLML